MVKLFYTKPSLQDLKNIYDWIAADSPQAAKRFVSTLKEKIKILKTYPEIGKPVFADKFPGLRQVLYKSYRIIYLFDEKNVTVITIHHQSKIVENIPALKDLF